MTKNVIARLINYLAKKTKVAIEKFTFRITFPAAGHICFKQNTAETCFNKFQRCFDRYNTICSPSKLSSATAFCRPVKAP